MGEKSRKKKRSHVSGWYKWFKESLCVEITNEDNAHHFDIKCIVHLELIPQGQKSQPTLCGNGEAIT
jgi:hypothetical protein